MTRKALALLSGGLDSVLAARLVAEQGIEVVCLAFVIGFAAKDNSRFERHVRETAENAALPIRVIDITSEFLEVLATPSHGYGANINPCIDCKTLMLKKAKEIMEKEGFSFVITGEVLGQRPMSQRREALDMIVRDSDLKGKLLRPLSAKLLPETEAETKGIVDRSRLMAISGRSRKPQLEMAGRYGMKNFAQPAGGCLLTEPGFAAMVKDLIMHGGIDLDGLAILKLGRHFRVDEKTKIILGRDEKENEAIAALKKAGDIMLRLSVDPGPYALLRGDASEENIRKAASLVISFSKKKSLPEAEVEYWREEENIKTLKVSPFSLSEIKNMRI
ncbi:MAG: tRNA 4-thiouridine(8) synthase ThiI [Candidatus Omnitrophica bacterium]|nr:tRNA 4-thiouridine(8) synthase ThiI [Candidatus Omnitrophota bacterium]